MTHIDFSSDLTVYEWLATVQRACIALEDQMIKQSVLRMSFQCPHPAEVSKRIVALGQFDIWICPDCQKSLRAVFQTR